jgi:hypothetical protein
MGEQVVKGIAIGKSRVFSYRCVETLFLAIRGKGGAIE